jgi:glycine cleavage system H protein
MPIDPKQTVYYKRARFTTRLPTPYLYTPSHCWLKLTEPGVYRIGLTKFATRMLGDFVECEFRVSPGECVSVGESIGWIEGFKALSDIYCVADGAFLARNGDLDATPTVVDTDPYDRGWLYEVRGEPAENTTDVGGYVAHLDLTIDRMLAAEKAHQNEDDRKC